MHSFNVFNNSFYNRSFSCSGGTGQNTYRFGKYLHTDISLLIKYILILISRSLIKF